MNEGSSGENNPFLDRDNSENSLASSETEEIIEIQQDWDEIVNSAIDHEIGEAMKRHPSSRKSKEDISKELD